MKKILLVLTGGTICAFSGSDHTRGLDVARAKALLEENFRASGSPFASVDATQFAIGERFDTLSENMTFEVWNRVKTYLDARPYEGFDGVVIAHGTDTLGIAGAAVSTRDRNASLSLSLNLRDSVPFFFTVSAFLFFRRIDVQAGWRDEVNLAQLKHFLRRIGTLYLVWTIIYLPYTAIQLHNGASILRWLFDCVFNGSYYHLWFLPALMLATLIVYLLYLNCGMKKSLIVCGLLYLAGSAVNVYGDVLCQIPVIEGVAVRIGAPRAGVQLINIHRRIEKLAAKI